MRSLNVAVAMTVFALASPARGADAPDGVSLSLELGKETAYPGQRIPMTVTMRVAGPVVRNISYPQLVEHKGAVATFAPPQRNEEEGATVFRFNSSVTVRRPGRIPIGPAEVRCEVMETDEGRASFFGTVTPRAVTLSSAPVSLTVLPLPSSGSPGDFSGAVGTFTMAVAGKPDAVSPGDPVTILSRISGNGALADAACPSVSGGEFRTYPPRIVSRGNGLVCEQVVVPTAVVPPTVTWSFFDPDSGEYRVLKNSPPLRIIPRPKDPSMSAPPPLREGAATQVQGPDRGVPFSAVAVPLAIAASALGGWKLMRRREHAIPEAATSLPAPSLADHVLAAEQAMHQDDVITGYGHLLAVMQQIIARRTGLPAGSICAVPHDFDFPSAHAIQTLLSRCDSVRYGFLRPSRKEMAADIESARTILNAVADLFVKVADTAPHSHKL